MGDCILCLQTTIPFITVLTIGRLMSTGISGPAPWDDNNVRTAFDLNHYNMAAPRYPTTQYPAGKFLLSAGSVLFRRNPSSDRLEICLIYHNRKREWVLPKGRKDRGESLEITAVRETYEETGYPCALWPQRMPTRAPAPGHNVHAPESIEGLTEPITMSVRDLGDQGVKVVWWYITLAKEGASKAKNSQMANEAFDSMFVDAQSAAKQLTFRADQDVVKQALEIVMNGKNGKSQAAESMVSRNRLCNGALVYN